MSEKLVRIRLVADEQDPFERELQPLARVDRVEQVPRVLVAADDDRLPALLVPACLLNRKDEVVRIDQSDVWIRSR